MNKCIMVKDIKEALIELAKSDKRLERETTTKIIKAFGNLPTIDIVRCKDCKYWSSEDDGSIHFCELTEAITNADDYCSYGERSR